MCSVNKFSGDPASDLGLDPLRHPAGPGSKIEPCRSEALLTLSNINIPDPYIFTRIRTPDPYFYFKYQDLGGKKSRIRMTAQNKGNEATQRVYR